MMANCSWRNWAAMAGTESMRLRQLALAAGLASATVFGVLNVLSYVALRLSTFA